MKNTNELTDKEIAIYKEFLRLYERGDIAESIIAKIEHKHNIKLDREYLAKIIDEHKIVKSFIDVGFIPPPDSSGLFSRSRF